MNFQCAAGLLIGVFPAVLVIQVVAGRHSGLEPEIADISARTCPEGNLSRLDNGKAGSAVSWFTILHNDSETR